MSSRKIRFYTGNRVSKGLNALRREMPNARKIKRVGSTYRGYDSHLIINWGSSEMPSYRGEILNRPESVRKASSKVLFFQTVPTLLVPPHAFNREDARGLLEGSKVYCRTLARSCQGRGIVIATNEDELVDAPLYTQALEVVRELRLHVFKDRVFHFVQKKKMSSERLEAEGIEINCDIRNHQNGWVFAMEGVTIPQEAKDIAISAVSALGLDFGAIDMCECTDGSYKVFEVNTSPGLEGTTLIKYKEVFEDYARSCSGFTR